MHRIEVEPLAAPDEPLALKDLDDLVGNLLQLAVDAVDPSDPDLLAGPPGSQSTFASRDAATAGLSRHIFVKNGW